MISVHKVEQGEGPLVWQVERGMDAKLPVVLDWFSEHKHALERDRDKHGMVLIRGFKALDSAESFAGVLDRVAFELMDYIGGSAPRVPVYGKVSTTSHLPANFSLPLHQEMAYQEYRPDVLALFCQVPASEGGQTPVADARAVTARIDADVRQRFDERGLELRRWLPKEQAPDRIPRPWPAVFDTPEPDKVEQVAAEKGWRVDWQADESLFLWQPNLPSFKSHPRTNERVWANQVHYHTPECMLLWALRDQRDADAAALRALLADTPEHLDYVYHQDGERVDSADTEHVFEVLAESEVLVEWQANDVMFLDNVLSMHGRCPYQGPRRVLAGLMLDDPSAPKFWDRALE